MILTVSVGAGFLNTFPKPIIIVGTIAIFAMNVFHPISEYFYFLFTNSKKHDVKGNSFIISLVISLITAIFSYIFLKDIAWFENLMKNGFVWGVNTAILLLNIAILEIENNNLKSEEMYYEREKDKIDKIKLKKEVIKLKKELILRDQKGENYERKDKHTN